MASTTPIFPMPEPQHYSDYGFDPQIDYFQVLHEARKHTKRDAARSLDAFRFKLHKPISKDDSRRASKVKKRGWWRSARALLFWKRKGGNQGTHHHATASAACSSAGYAASAYSYPYQAVSCPLYMTESSGAGSAGGWSPGRRSGGAGWGGHSAGPGELNMPYLCLRDLAAMDASPSPSSAACSSPALPIYLVT